MMRGNGSNPVGGNPVGMSPIQGRDKVSIGANAGATLLQNQKADSAHSSLLSLPWIGHNDRILRLD